MGWRGTKAKIRATGDMAFVKFQVKSKQNHNGLARPGRAVNWIQALGFLITRVWVGVPIVTLVPLSKTLDYYWLVLWIGHKASERILFILFISWYLRFLGVSLEGSTVNIFMQFIPGGSIASLLARFGALEEPVFCRYTKQILQGTEYLHSKDVIHR